VVADAEVEIKNVETNLSVTVKTNQDGLYTIPSLHPGHYLISARKPGFKSVTVTDVTLNVQDNVVRNFSLQVGSIAETVTVRAEDLHINTTDATVSTVVDRQFAENLPMNGRSFQTLIQLTPGVVITPVTNADSGQFSVNGQRAASNYWTVDGVSANVGITSTAIPGNGLAGSIGSVSVLGGTNSLVSVDAMQEFRIQTSTYAPEFGRTPGGQISIVTRSGTNQFHGTAFDYFRNDILDASNWFNGFCTAGPKCPLPKAKERQNDFGGTFSGPIIRDKTFFFFSYEGLRLRLPQTALTTVPCDSTCTISGNARAAATAAMRPFLNAFPLPNGADHGNGTADFNASFSNPATLDAYSLRIDHRLRDKLNLFGRYNYSPSTLSQRGSSGQFALSTVASTRITTQTATLGTSWLMSPTFTNDFRFNYSRTNASGDQKLDSFGGAAPLSALPFPSPFTAQNGQFEFNIFTLSPIFLGAGKQPHNLQRQLNLVDSLSAQTGSHTVKVGVDYRRLSPRYEPQSYTQFGFFGDVAAAGQGNLALSVVEGSRSGDFLFRNLGIFAQDTWRLIPRLTITYGLRWDVDFAPSTTSGPDLNSASGFNLNNLSGLGLASAGTPPFQTRYGNLAPRVGLAYRVSQNQSWQTALRGGFGVFYDLATSEVGNSLDFADFPFGAATLAFGGTFDPAAPPSPPAITAGSLSSPGSTFHAVDPNLKLPYTLEWNVAIEQGLGPAQTASVSYLGSVARRLIQTTLITAPNANIAQAQLVTNAGTSDYDALQIEFQRRLVHGLQTLASYTWSHSIDTASAGSAVGGVTGNALVPSTIAGSNRGSSDFDIRHAFSAGVTYEIPAPKGSSFLNEIVRGWATENFVFARSAPPVTVNGFLINGVFVGTSIGGFFTLPRPNVVPGEPFYLFGPQFPGGKALNIAAFTTPPPNPQGGFLNGDLGRNALRGFGAWQWDFAVHRDFGIRETMKIQFRAEMFNVLNHPNFGQPNGLLSGSPTFGEATQMLGQSLAGAGTTGLTPLHQVGGPRSIQFALKFAF
jgi:hypothetical protein